MTRILSLCPYCGAPIQGGGRCPRCRYRQPEVGQKVFTPGGETLLMEGGGGGGGISAPIINPLGTIQDKTSSSTLSIALTVSNASRRFLVATICYDATLGQVIKMQWAGGTGQNILFLQDQVVGVNTITEIRSSNVTISGSGSLVVTFSGNSVQKAMVVSEIIGIGGVTSIGSFDGQKQATGTSSTPDSGSSATTHVPDFFMAALGTEGPQTDAAGTWQNGLIGGQRVGTTGGADASNATVEEAFLFVPTLATLQAKKTGAANRAWSVIADAIQL